MTVLWIAVAVALVVISIDLLFILPTQWLKVERVTWTRHPNTKILQISDLHIERNRVTEKILQVLAQEQPDYVFLTGDYLDSLKAMGKLSLFLKKMAFYRIPTYAVFGNHDYLLHDIIPLLELMKEHGITVLRNESVSLPEFDLVGIDDFCTENSDIDAAFFEVQKQRTKQQNRTDIHQSSVTVQEHVHQDPQSWRNRRCFVITHDPNIVLSIDYPYDVLISGHLHGKQFNVPLLFALQPMGSLTAQGIYKGVHSTSYGRYYISKGAGQSGFNARLFVRSEITLHFV
ncbi:metallophosphoesterase [Alicyclobacillus sp. SO9]|uniref:metallophosphoesterase n=1 Tax=Alicyclobacillus sp. SO9 TaxID=2665646 RepID=UPI0018E858DE|nr:metallophosphoesterase [Alicyclobacillus sp. SO9]QQE79144.1 metallophosphoesterase [Alicyclobacillus sp. SO9]